MLSWPRTSTRTSLKSVSILGSDCNLACSNTKTVLNNPKVLLTAGGAAQNTARGAQYILPPKSVIYFGCVGKDKYADILSDAAKKAGLEVRYRVDEEQPTGRCGVVVTGHDRSLVTDLAAANCYKLDHLKEHWDIVEKSKAYFVGGYHLTVCVPAIMALAEEAAAKNKVCAFARQSISPQR
jgi:adenosine kinase